MSQVRLATSSNQSGTYYNGPLNNGVKATFTYATGALTIDSVTVNVGDRVLLMGQTAANQNGIYVCTTAGATGVAAVLQRADDMQCIEQLKAGQYASVGAGSVNAGNFFTVIEPIPAIFGVSDLVISADPSAGGVTFSGGASTANALVVFSDTSGNIKAATTTATLGQSLSVTGTVTGSTGLTATTGDVTATAGNLVAGSSGNAGTVISFPATAANGSLILSALNAGGAFNTTIRNSVMGQSTVYSLGDIGAATGGIPVSTAPILMKSVAGAAAAGGAAAQSFTDAFCTSGSNVIGNWNTQANAASVLKIVPGNGSFVVTSSADAGVGTFNYVIMK